ncbi:MAG: deoxyribonuclease V [Nitrospinota bacterium]|nr:deoxyribonuclease V [Nitrospinota bacterium]
MKINYLHQWNVGYNEASAIQKKLAATLKFIPPERKIRLVAGADISSKKGDDRLYASVVVLRIPEMEIIESRSAVLKAEFPYLPGFLAFREVPVLCKAFEKLNNTPDAVICDGHGIAHPRGLGLASHLGLFLELPTVGCAKNLLVGEFDAVGNERMEWSELRVNGEGAGAVLRTRTGVKPLYVSPGHLMDIGSSVRLVEVCLTRYRLPEPTRLAHQHVNSFRMEKQGKR